MLTRHTQTKNNHYHHILILHARQCCYFDDVARTHARTHHANTGAMARFADIFHAARIIAWVEAFMKARGKAKHVSNLAAPY